jgi:hypothetical protein
MHMDTFSIGPTHGTQQGLRWMENTYKDNARGWVGFNVALSHRLTAAADLLLMPSRFEARLQSPTPTSTTFRPVKIERPRSVLALLHPAHVHFMCVRDDGNASCRCSFVDSNNVGCCHC